jgi:chemotaxis response regulator CheB
METLLTGMGIGEAAVTILSETGVPTPVVHTRMTPPASRMGPADDVEGKAKASPLWAKYGQRVDNQSAREILAARMAPPAEETEPAQPVRPKQAAAPHRQPAAEHKEAAGALAGGVAAVTSFLNSKEGKQLQKQVVRGVFGLLKKKR